MADNVVEVVIRAKDETLAAVESATGRFKSLQSLLLGIGGAATAMTVGITAIAYSFAGSAVQALKLSSATGLAVEEVTRLSFAAGQSETSIEALAVGFKTLQVAQYEAVRGNEELVRAFAKLGIETRELRKLDARTLFLRIADGLRGVDDAAERTRLRVLLFGKSGNELASLLAAGSEAIKKLEAESDRLGGTLSRASVVMGDELGDTTARLKSAMDGLKASIATAVIPALVEIIDRSTEAAVGVRKWTEAHQPLTTALFLAGARTATFVAIVAPLAAALSFATHAVRLFGGAMKSVLGPIGLVILAVQGVLFVLDLLREKAREKYTISIRVASEGIEETRSEIKRFEAEQKRLADERKKIEDALREERAKAPPERRDLGERGWRLEQVPGGQDPAKIRALVLEHQRLTDEIKDNERHLDRLKKLVESFEPPKTGPGTEEAAKAYRSLAEAIEATVAQEERRQKLEEEALARKFGYEAIEDLRKKKAEALKALREIKPTEEVGPFEKSNQALAEFLRYAGLSSDAIEEFGAKMRREGKSSSDILTGLSAGVLAFAEQIRSGLLDPSLVVAEGIFYAFSNAVSAIGDEFGAMFSAIFLEGKNVFQSLSSFFRSLGQVVKQLVSEIIAAIAKAVILRIVLGAFGLSKGGVVGGIQIVTGKEGGLVAFANPVRALAGYTVPGLPQKIDRVPALLTPGEVVLATVAGRSPERLLGQLADLEHGVRKMVSAPRGTERGGDRITNFNVSTLNATSFRETWRRGDFRREIEFAEEVD